jgi:hypothetical protein
MDFWASNITTMDALMLVTHLVLAGDGARLGVTANMLVDRVADSSVAAQIRAGA